MKKKIALIMALLLATSFAFAGCQTTEPDLSPTAGSESTTSKVGSNPFDIPEGTDETPALINFEKFDPPITITFVRSAPPVATAGFLEGDDISNNPWTREIKDKLGIIVEYLWVVDNSQFAEKLSVMLSTNQMPDLLTVNYDQFSQLAKADALADLTDLYPKWASQRMQTWFEGMAPSVKESVTIDGKLRGMPHDLWKDGELMCYIRKDWMEKLNIDVNSPKTVEDVMEIAQKFVDNDMAGSGETIGFPIDSSLGMQSGVNTNDGAVGLLNSYGAYPNTWIEKNGKLEHGAIQPEAKAALIALNNLYKKGVINKDFPTTNMDKVYEQLVAGKGGVAYGAWWFPLHPLQQGRNLDPKMDWQPYPIMASDGTVEKGELNSRPDLVVVASKKCEHPEALFLITKLASDLMNATDPDKYAKFVSGKNGEEIWIQKPPISYAEGSTIADLQDKYMAPLIKGETTIDKVPPEIKTAYNLMQEFLNDKKEENWCWYLMNKEDGSRKVISTYYKNSAIHYNAYAGPVTNEMSDIEAILKTLILTSYTEIIQSNNVDADFDKFVEKWYSQGGDVLTSQVNEWFANK